MYQLKLLSFGIVMATFSAPVMAQVLTEAPAQGTDGCCSQCQCPSQQPSQQPSGGTTTYSQKTYRPPQQSRPNSAIIAKAAVTGMVDAINQWQQMNDQIAAADQRAQEQAKAQQAEADRIARQNNAKGLQQFQNFANDVKGGGGAPGTGMPGSSSEDNPWAPEKSVKDPSEDYAGQSCSYFTKPATDGTNRINAYADGSFVVYGEIAYECVNRRWVKKGPAGAFNNADRYRAERLEGN